MPYFCTSSCHKMEWLSPRSSPPARCFARKQLSHSRAAKRSSPRKWLRCCWPPSFDVESEIKHQHLLGQKQGRTKQAAVFVLRFSRLAQDLDLAGEYVLTIRRNILERQISGVWSCPRSRANIGYRMRKSPLTKRSNSAPGFRPVPFCLLRHVSNTGIKSGSKSTLFVRSTESPNI